MEAIVLAGGKGTRLKSVVSDVPKPMAPINGRPFLEYLLDYLYNQNIKKIILAVGYKWRVIYDYFGLKFKDINIIYSIEDVPLGTGGAIKKALDHVEGDNTIIINGDTFSNISLEEMWKKHEKFSADLTIATKKMYKFDRYGRVIDKENRIIEFLEKKYCEEGNINIGTYILKKNLLDNFHENLFFSFETDIMEKYVKEKKFITYLSDTFFIDIGIPEDYKRFQKINLL